MGQEGAERRANQRYSTEFKLQGTPEEGGVVARMEASNLSLGGLYCTSSADFPEMTRLAVRLQLPLNGKIAGSETEPVDLDAVVVRRRQLASAAGESERFELALFFTNVEDEVRERLSRYLDR